VAQKSWLVILSAAIIIAGSVSWFQRWHEVTPSGTPDFSLIPLTKDDWVGTVRELSKEELDILKANKTYAVSYRKPTSGPVDLFIAYFTSQKYGSSIHSPKNCLPGSGWIINSQKKVNVEIDGQTIKINKMAIVAPGKRSMVYYWYLTRSGEIDGEMGLKLDLIKNSLTGRATDGALIRFTAPLPEGFNDSPDIRELLNIFIKDVYSSLPLRQ
jgi:EpsI family protein